ncbi:hypothetical protein [Micromonospora sp. NBRC 107095]|uniref:hypothetical protein n=1 Tax=Micromonospora sp. NBRC 107095 TaxID=3032209 RepID=UPI0024A58E8C|nr:hypothetical protein [Micromonospora sp. NBRC 107095]GLZ62836.1 hypothetical protein Misp05_64120 [Micromonospora sp. NBRC 107095]
MTNTVTTSTEDRRLLAEVHRWARIQGWRAGGWRGYQNAQFEDKATVTVRPNEAGFQVWRKDADALFFTGQPTEYPTATVREAIDILVAIGILPPAFSSAYRLGRSDGAFIANVETNPDRKCAACGATSGLTLLPGNPLTGIANQWLCWGTCKAATR